MRGTMLWFNASKDYGFISTEDGERLYVPGTAFSVGEKPEGRCAGRPVSFDVDGDASARKAEGVVFVPDETRTRARLRRGGSRSTRH